MPADTDDRAEATPHSWGSPREGWSDGPSSIPTRRTRTAARPQRTADGGRSPRQTEAGSKTEGRQHATTPRPVDAAAGKEARTPKPTRDTRRNAGAREASRPAPRPRPRSPPPASAERNAIDLGERWASPSPCPSQSRFVLQPDWPSPQSQSLSRSYGSNLPTSLTYIVASTRGC